MTIETITNRTHDAELIETADRIRRPRWDASNAVSLLLLEADAATIVPPKTTLASGYVAIRPEDNGPVVVLKRNEHGAYVTVSPPKDYRSPGQKTLSALYASGHTVTYADCMRAADVLKVTAAVVDHYGITPESVESWQVLLNASLVMRNKIKGVSKPKEAQALLTETPKPPTEDVVRGKLRDARAKVKAESAIPGPNTDSEGGTRSRRTSAQTSDPVTAVVDALKSLVAAVESGEYFPADGSDTLLSQSMADALAVIASARTGEPIKG